MQTSTIYQFGIEKNVNLWHDVYGFDNIHVINYQEKKSVLKYEIISWLIEIQSKMRLHRLVILMPSYFIILVGDNDSIITSDGIGLAFDDIYDRLMDPVIHELYNVPTIIFMDCCRGSQEIKHVQEMNLAPTESTPPEKKKYKNKNVICLYSMQHVMVG